MFWPPPNGQLKELVTGRPTRAAKSSRVARSAVHVSLGVLIVLATLTLGKELTGLTLAALTALLLVLELSRFSNASLQSWALRYLGVFMRREEEERLTGASWFLTGCALTVALFPREIAVLSVLFLTLGDPLAGAVGHNSSRLKLWGKTLEGNLTFLAASLAGVVVLAAMHESPPVGVAVAGTIAATLVQALPTRLDDNLTIPLCSALAMAIVQKLLL